MSLNFGSNLFPPRGEIISSYDYFDITSLTGYKTFYVARANAGTYIVTSNSNLRSETTETRGATDTNSETINTRTYFPDIGETDIDLQFNKPTNIKGDIFLDIPIGIEGDTTRLYYLCRCKMYHYDGSTETQIGSTVISQEYSYDSDASNKGLKVAVAAIKIVAANTVHFKAGDILRLTLEVLSTENGTVFKTAFGHDPTNRYTSSAEDGSGDEVFKTSGDVTQFKWIVPFKLDI